MCVLLLTLCAFYASYVSLYSRTLSLPFPLGCVLSQFWCQPLEPSIDVVSESELGSFIYETVYDAASTIDYSKEPLDAGVVDSPPPKKIFRQSPSPSPLKGVDRGPVSRSPSKPSGGITPQRRLCMDVRPTKSASLPIPSRDPLPLPANSDANDRRVKVPPLLLRPFHGLGLSIVIHLICLSLSTETNSCGCCVVQWLPGCARPQTSAAQCGSSAGTLLCLAL